MKKLNLHILALIAANTIWGAAVPIFKYSLGNIPPFTLLFIRFFVAALLFIPFAWGSWRRLSIKEYGEVFLAAFFGFTLAISFLFLGLAHAPSINFPIIASAGPIVLYCAAIFVLKEKPHKKILVGSLISLCGVLAIVLSPILFNTGTNPGQVQGNIFFVVAVIAQAIYVLLSKKVLGKVGVFQATLLMFMFAAITYFPFMVNELRTWSFTQLDIRGLSGILYGTIFSSAIAYYLYHWGIEQIDAQEIGIFTYLDPVTTVIVAFFLLGETPSVYYFFGALLVFTGIFIAENRLHWHPVQRIKQ